MSLSNATLSTAFNSGKQDGNLETPCYTCAGCDPQILNLLAEQPVDTRNDALTELANAWDNGYNSARAQVLATRNQENN